MIRKLAVALSLASVLSASVVQALGLGEASVESTLNQPLKAEIELVNIRDLEDNEILPGLASREEFLKAGVERIYFLSDVRFEVQHKEDGKVVVKLTTNKPVREPFLNFLVEVIWPSGRLLREYALLIDPPIFSEEPLAPVQQVESSSTAGTSTVPASSTAVAETTEPVSGATAVSAPSSSDATYGPTNSSDTMWAIALNVRPDKSVTAQQTMLAIQKLNPDSFINNNINSLKTGQILRLPELNQIRQLSKREAVRGVIAQNRSFENKALSRNVVDAAPEEVTPEQVAPVAQPAKTGDELKLVVAEASDADQQSGAHAGESTTNGSSSALQNDLAITLEKLDQSNLEKKELNSRVTDLEEQLETLQRLLTLKDDQLANLQTQMGQDDAVPVVEELPQAGEAVVKEAQVVEGDGVVSGVGSEIAVDTTPEASESTKPELAPVATTPVATTPVATTPVETAPIETPVTKSLSMQSVIDLVLNNPLYQALVGGVVILLLLIVWALSRRNAQKEQEFFETRNEQGEEPGDIFDVDADSDVEGIEGATVGVDDVDLVSGEDVTAVQSETEDVIAEADIYIAYGRLDQASQLLENAISSEPQRADIRIKLLEVYAESNEIESFDKQFNEIEALNDDYALEQATQIRARTEGADSAVSIDDLESQLLSGESTGSEGHPPIEYDAPEEGVDLPESDVADDLLSIDEELSDLESELELDSVAEVDDNLAEEDDLDIDFDINEIDLDADESTLDEASSLDFDLGNDEQPDSRGDETELDLTIDEDLELDLELEEEQVVDDLDLELTAEEVSTEAISELESELVEDDLGLDLEVAELDSVSEGAGEEELSLDEGELSLDDLDLELDKIDSDLDVNFDAEVSGDESEELVELEGDLNLEVEDSLVEDLDAEDLSGDLESDSALEELEDIADVLAGDESLDDVSVDDLELDSAVLSEELDDSIDDSLLEGAELSLGEDDNFDSELTEDEDFDFLAGTDEAATKLDLARAYIDMGDADGAKDILEEVSLEGNDEQKQDAQELLKTLD